MRLERLDLTRYGRFSGRNLDFAAPAPGASDLHIIYGPNEAGKSTLFSAWLDLLFGIPTRSRYDFLHRGPTMQIGATLSHGAERLDLKRVKKNSGSLLDRHDAPIPEAVLQSALGGLSRDGYSAMFSLDDDTLEKGGDSILANRGDLGEMLFSASAGLSNLAPRLEAIRTELDGFHSRGKRSGWLYDAKKQLADLDRQRREIEVSATSLQKLMRSAAAAELDWREARGREDDAQTDLDRLQEMVATLPMQARLAELEARLAPLAHLPDADATLQDRLGRIERDRLVLTGRIADRELRMQGMRDQLTAVTTDPDILTQANAIEATEALRPEHDTAIKDLPRRRQEADEATAHLKALMSELGHRDGLAADLALPAARISQMRALLSARSGLQASVRATANETRKAADLLTQERNRLGDPGPATDEATLSALMTRLRAQDPADALSRAVRDRDMAEGKLATTIEALAPWVGDAETLAALNIPASWQIGEWETALEAARQQDMDAGRETGDLRTELQRQQAEAADRSQAQSAAGVSLADAAAARGLRETQWAAHLDELTQASAAAFEQAMREDDRISALLAEAMAEAKRDALQQAAQQTLSARIEGAVARGDAARTVQTTMQAAIDEACICLGLQGASLADLRRWLELRLVALTERAALRDADVNLRRCEDAVVSAQLALGSALGRADAATGDAFEILFAEAQARLAASDRNREARQRLKALGDDLRLRERDDQEALDALTRWQTDWATAAQDSVLADHADDDPGLGTAVDLLDQLGTDARTLAILHDRIEKMEANRDRFLSAKTAVHQALDLGEDHVWTDILTRLRRAQDNAREHETLLRQVDVENQQETQDQRELTARDNEATALGETLGWAETDQTTLPAYVANCVEATALRTEIATLRKDLNNRPVPEEGDSADDIRQRVDLLKADQQLLRAETEARLAAHLDAKRQIDAVGGDDALALIAANRENLLLEARDRTRAHLIARLGLLSVEAALRRYRDLHRSAMLARASDAFRQLSRGAYTGLAAQPDGAQEVLVALSTGGGAKLAVDLSKGTRFQLYLALRIAGYHELAQSRPTVPFIADDIMETFDDDRSAAAFALLADMSRVGQVIYLTHHRHLCDIAQASCPAANVIEL